MSTLNRLSILGLLFVVLMLSACQPIPLPIVAPTSPEIDAMRPDAPTYAQRGPQTVLYVTERAVFELTKEGMLLKEIAPGIDLERDVLGQMGFRPIIPDEVKVMDATLFS